MGREWCHQVMDVTDSEELAALAAAVQRRFGRSDICVTNPARPPSNSFENTKLEDWRAAFDQHPMSTRFSPRETLLRMQQNESRRLITITSFAVKMPAGGGLVRSML